MSQTPSIGRIVHYTLTDSDAEQINRRRADAVRNMHMHRAGVADGSQVHVGNEVYAEEVYPLLITRVWLTPESVNGQVLLDGNDTLWATSVTEGEGPGHYAWPARV